MDVDNPLTDLYVTDDFDKRLLAGALKGIIGIDPESGDSRFLPRWSGLNGPRKVTGFLLYRKAAAALGHVPASEEGVSSREIAEAVGGNYNSIRSYLARLDFIANDSKLGGHHIPPYALQAAINYFGGDSDE